MNAWMAHLKKVREENPGKSMKDCMKLAGKTYKKGGSAELSEADKPTLLTGGKRKSKTSSKGKRTKKARKGKKKAKKSVKRRSRRSRK